MQFYIPHYGGYHYDKAVAGHTIDHHMAAIDGLHTCECSRSDRNPCGCGQSLSQINRKLSDANTNSAPMGHDYLDGDYAQAEQRTLISGSKTVIDLRGHTLTTDGSHRLFLVEGYLAVLDTVGGGRMQAKTTGSGYGGVLKTKPPIPPLSCTAVH